ncbi:MAG: ATP-binding protein [Pyrinomonadaceae bacterium]
MKAFPTVSRSRTGHSGSGARSNAGAFYRLDLSRGAGSGLGLAIADRIARLHHGEVTLLSRTGGGLGARVKLPRRNV